MFTQVTVTSLVSIGAVTPGVQEARKLLRDGLPATVAPPNRDAAVADLADAVFRGEVDRDEVARRVAAVEAMGSRTADELRAAVSQRIEAAAHRALRDDAAAIGKAVGKLVDDAEREHDKALGALRAAGVTVPDQNDVGLNPVTAVRNDAMGLGSAALARWEAWAAAVERLRNVRRVHADAAAAGLAEPLKPRAAGLVAKARAVLAG